MARGFTPGVDIGCFLQPVSAGYRERQENADGPMAARVFGILDFYIEIQTSKC